jgi:prepilin-type N-terminal cleavage/methylation domain-containing protein
MLTARLLDRLRDARGAHGDRVHHAGHGDAGVTLTEVLVAMVLTSIVGAMTVLMFTSTSSAVSDTTDSLTGSGDARVTLQTWQTLLQAADTPQRDDVCNSGEGGEHRFEWITTREILFYANLGNRSTDSSGTCTPQTMVWLALRDGALLEARYTIAAGDTTYHRTVCRTLSMKPQATVTAGSLFTPNPGQVSPTLNFGSTFAAGTAFAAATGCASTPASVAWTAVSNPTTDALAKVTAVGIDFSIIDSRSKHSQTYDATVAVLA